MQVEGTVEKIRYRKEESGWTVFELSTSDGSLICVGSLFAIREGQDAKVEGELVYHPKFGEQLQITSFQAVEPTTAEQLVRYLSSGVIPHIGKKRAERLVEEYGTNVLQVLRTEKEVLLQIRGIGPSKAQEIQEALEKLESSHATMLYLQKLGVGPKMANEIYRCYGDAAETRIQKNPYALVSDIPGIGFLTADHIARQIGIQEDSAERTKAGLHFLFERAAMQQGACYLSRSEMEKALAQLLGSLPQTLEEALFELVLEGKLVSEKATVLNDEDDAREVLSPEISKSGEEHWYLRRFDVAERVSAARIAALMEEKGHRLSLDREALEKAIGLELDEAQKSAIQRAASEPVLVITGGPGTGKTTIVRAILELFHQNGLVTQLAAPTGRAAKRLEQSTGQSALTVHRLLGYRGRSGHRAEAAGKEALGSLNESPRFEALGFDDPREENGKKSSFFEGNASNENEELYEGEPSRNADHPIEADAIVVDELSMVDLELLSHLLDAISDGTRLVLVGDADQLPSVGPGNVLHDLITSGVVPVVVLERIYRQSERSGIVENAHRVRLGQEVTMNDPKGDFFFLPTRSARDAADVIEDLVVRRLPAHYGLSPKTDIQVLTAMKKGECGVISLNERLQRVLNPPRPEKKEIEMNERIFREGDAVMQIKNDYDLEWRISDREATEEGTGQGVYNGDFGVLTHIDDGRQSLEVNFDGRLVTYEPRQFREIDFSYAITIHKSQGSEFPCVVVAIVPGAPMLLTRNILYTAMTRARSLCVLVGDAATLHRMIANQRVERRNSSLDGRLRQAVEARKNLRL